MFRYIKYETVLNYRDNYSPPLSLSSLHSDKDPASFEISNDMWITDCLCRTLCWAERRKNEEIEKVCGKWSIRKEQLNLPYRLGLVREGTGKLTGFRLFHTKSLPSISCKCYSSFASENTFKSQLNWVIFSCHLSRHPARQSSANLSLPLYSVEWISFRFCNCYYCCCLFWWWFPDCNEEEVNCLVGRKSRALSCPRRSRFNLILVVSALVEVQLSIIRP